MNMSGIASLQGQKGVTTRTLSGTITSTLYSATASGDGTLIGSSADQAAPYSLFGDSSSGISGCSGLGCRKPTLKSITVGAVYRINISVSSCGVSYSEFIKFDRITCGAVGKYIFYILYVHIKYILYINIYI